LQIRSETDVSVTGTQVTQGTLVTTETKPTTAGRPGSKSKRSTTNPFEQKEKFHGPARRVVDIIEWARISVGGSPKKQKRKLSAVEKRLLKRYDSNLTRSFFSCINDDVDFFFLFAVR
jgi:hypothetical protein